MKPLLVFVNKLNKKQKIASVLVGALAIVFVGVAVWQGTRPEKAPPTEPSEETPAPTVYRHPLTGAKLEMPLEKLPHVYAVMIDTSVDAWPQSGVDDAFLVIEAPVEAGIPRIEVFFSEEIDVPKIGPVRSARPYFVDWANELDALYTHVGGSNDALELIASNGTFDLNQFWYDQYFWRSTDRYAPHNVYTSTDLLAKAVQAAKDRGRVVENLYGTWQFQDAVPAESRPAEGVDATIDFYSSTYRVVWQYDETSGRYRRIHGGRSESTLEGDAVFADNVAVVITDMAILDSVGRRQVDTIGEGEAYVFQNGVVIEGTWKKPSESERLRFYGADGVEVIMNAGTTWIEVVAARDFLSYQ